MNEQQEAFAKAFVVNGGNAALAALSAGYSPKRSRQSGHELANRPDVRAFIDRLRRDRGQGSDVDPAWLEEQFVHYAEGARRHRGSAFAFLGVSARCPRCRAI